MRQLLFILFLFPVLLKAQTTYYISPWGNDVTGVGTQTLPWRTFYKAIVGNTELISGDRIYALNGIYNEVQQITVPVDIDIEGESMAGVVIESTYAASGQPLFKLETTNGWLGIYGNQTISYLTIDGNLTTYAAMHINFRSNVVLHHLTVRDFSTEGIKFWGQPSWTWTATNIMEPTKTMPNYWCSGNEFHNNIMINCSAYTNEGKGNLLFGQQSGFQCYNNTIIQTARASGSNGYGIKFCDDGWNRGSQVHHNTITVDQRPSGKYNFAIENWNDLDECEYYDNVIIGTIDFTGAHKRATNYACYVYDNTIGFTSTPDNTEEGLMLEAYVVGARIVNNHFKNLTNGMGLHPIWTSPDHIVPSFFDDIWITGNLFTGIGITGSDWTYGGLIGISYGDYDTGDVIKNVHIYNNTIVSSGKGARTDIWISCGILLPSGAATDLFDIRNNIIVGFNTGYRDAAPIVGMGATVNSNLTIHNNLSYNNGNANLPKYTTDTGGHGNYVPGAGYNYLNNIIGDPLFKSLNDWHLSNGSPGIRSGISVIVPYPDTDYDGINWLIPRSTGAYEYISGNVLLKHDGKFINFGDQLIKR